MTNIEGCMWVDVICQIKRWWPSCILDCPMCLDDHCLCDLLPVWIIPSGYLSTRLDCLPCPVLLFWCLPHVNSNPSPPPPLAQLHSPSSVLCVTRYGSCKGSNCYTGITVCDLRQWTRTPQSYQPRHSGEKECWKTPSHVRWDFANERMYFERNVRFYF